MTSRHCTSVNLLDLKTWFLATHDTCTILHFMPFESKIPVGEMSAFNKNYSWTISCSVNFTFPTNTSTWVLVSRIFAWWCIFLRWSFLNAHLRKKCPGHCPTNSSRSHYLWRHQKHHWFWTLFFKFSLIFYLLDCVSILILNLIHDFDHKLADQTECFACRYWFCFWCHLWTLL